MVQYLLLDKGHFITEFGKLANMTVCDSDFLHDDIEKVVQAKIVATIVDGEEVYKA